MSSRKRTSDPSYTPQANPERAHWMRELRKSSATTPQTPKPRKGTRREREREAIRDHGRDTP